MEKKNLGARKRFSFSQNSLQALDTIGINARFWNASFLVMTRDAFMNCLG